MIIYCDRLTVGSCIQAIRLCWRGLLYRREVPNVRVLDPLPDRGWSVLLRIIMQWLGFHLEEAQFFAGHLRTPDGQPLHPEARSVSMELPLRAAERILARSKLLRRLNHEWGRNTIFKHIARSLELPALQIALRFMVAEALGYAAGGSKVFLIVQRRFAFYPDQLRALIPGLKVYFYRSWLSQWGGPTSLRPGRFEFFRQRRASALLLLFFEKLRELKWSMENLFGRRSDIQGFFNASGDGLPSLFVLQEDDVSLDRSYRTQPHWLFAKDGKPPFQTLILQVGSASRLPVDTQALKEQGVLPLSRKQLYLISRPFRSSHLQQRIRKDLFKCALTSILGPSVEVGAVFEVARLLYIAAVLAAFCERARVKAFMTCENYMKEADAMQLIAPALDIVTLSYQYSNVSKVGPLTMTTADMMLTFSPHYHRLFTRGGIRPKEFVDIGYIFDTSFEYVKARARAHRRRLANAGAQFVVCYFDENVGSDKYGLFSREDHCVEILALLKLVLDDSSVGLVVKTQFHWNSPQSLEEIARARVAAEATGRYMELIYGAHRNIFFPAEAALSADLAIGHAVGATAPLEAALAGARCILLNPYGITANNDPLYAQADIVYPSMPEALEAISSFRSGAPARAGLGDWSPIIGHFDPYRDGRAGHRLRNFLEHVMLRESP